MRFKISWTTGRIVRVTEPAQGVRLIEIAPDGGPQPYNAGAHIDVSVLVNNRPETRQYSLVGPVTAEGHYQIAVRRVSASRGGSEYLWSLAEGARLSISQPQNSFPLTFGRTSYLLVAAGIGITPIYGMALELAERGADFRLLYAGSARAQMPLIDALYLQIGEKLSIFASDEGRRIDLDREIETLPAGVQLYICAPLRMLDTARSIWRHHGRPEGDLRFETFAASGQYEAQPFEVHVPRLGVTLTVPENQTMLDALAGAGVDVMFDCLRGECGLCVVDILECAGKVDHRDMFFSEEQKAGNHRMCACVSRVVDGRVVVDTSYRGKLSRI
jgi:vanillate O-demethylase ferredoxin subunit